MIRGMVVLLVGLVGVFAMAQTETATGIKIPFIEEAPNLDQFDGMKPSPAVASKMTKVTGFVQRSPNDGSAPSQATEAYLAYDHKFLYAIYLAFDSEPQKIRSRLAPREAVLEDDYVDLQLDTFNDRRRGYTFLVNPLGIQWDALWTEGQGFDESYDTIWHSEARRNDQGYMVLMRIPFSSLRFVPKPDQTWNILLNRSISRLKEESFWPRFTINIEGRLNQAAPMTGIEGINPGRNIRLNPYVFARNYRILDPETATYTEDSFDPEIGLDAKMIIADSFVLDATGNPDFSQVESDTPQVTVNERFEVNFPEKRPFFLENADFFRTPTNLVFTRRIVDPNAGVRFTGKKSGWSLGVLAIDDEAPGKSVSEESPDHGESAQIGILRVNRDIGDKHTVGVLFTHRDFAEQSNDVAAIDGRFKMGANWTSKFQVAHSETDDGYASSEGEAFNISADRTGRHFWSHTHYVRTTEGFATKLGFLKGDERPNVHNLHNEMGYTFHPEGKLSSWGVEAGVGKVANLDNDILESWTNPSVNIQWRNNNEFNLRYKYDHHHLDPAEFSSLNDWTQLTEEGLEYYFRSDTFSKISFWTTLQTGHSINFVPAEGQMPFRADRNFLDLGFRWRPISPLKVDGSYFELGLDEPETGAMIFKNSVARITTNWQFTTLWSLRLIGQLNDTKVNPDLTVLERDKSINTDVLLRYVLNPWTALYVGTNSNEANFEIVEGEFGRSIQRTDHELNNSGRQYFLKFSYLFQF